MTAQTAKIHQPWTSEKHPASTSALISSLEELRTVNPKAVKSTIHHYPASIYDATSTGQGSSRNRRITSWKMTEHLYFSAANQFPTLARGLFTEDIEAGDEVPDEAIKCEGQWEEGSVRKRIVARGYDKFFNVDEVDWTNWKHMKDHTQGPYRLTLKSNGCLILISALTPNHVMVASKHSLGTTTEAQVTNSAKPMDAVVDGVAALKVGETSASTSDKVSGGEDKEEKEAEAHAEVGRRWLKQTLQKSGKTEADLARRLWDSNSTAVLELCDDSFEEHVIATPEYWTGLHLHGLNHNTPHFSTALPAEVSSFAHEFGFIPTKFVEYPTLDGVKDFTDKIAEGGEWEGDMIEGFVIRCTVAPSSAPGKPPYRTGAPFFFKVKFDEPYLLYRQWREITRALLPMLNEKIDKTQQAEVWKKVRTKVRRQEVAVYADWCVDEMKKNPRLFEAYERGVVRVREVFLRWIESEGKTQWEAAKNGKYKLRAGTQKMPELDRSSFPKKYMLVPIAVPGCGKTMIGVALSRLFGFSHTQSDDVTTKRTAPAFLRNIVTLLKTNNVVYADRNNHIDKHYNELHDLTLNDKSLKAFNVRLIGIVWDVEAQPYHRLLRICAERVVKRGDNHQTLRPDLTIEAEHEAVVGQFLRNWTTPDPQLFDDLISVQVEDTPREALVKIVDGLVEDLDLSRPSDEEIDNALRAGEEYKVTTPYHAPAVRVGKAIRYFGVAPEINLPSIVKIILSSYPESSAAAFFDHLKTVNRVTAKPHITLAHEKRVAAEREAHPEDDTPGPLESLWNTCKSLAESSASSLYEFDITLLVWDDRVMALALDHIHPKQIGAGPELVLPEEVALYLHVTVGTRDEEISAFESRDIVRIAREAIAAGQGEEKGEAGEAVEGGGSVRWIRVQGVSSEGRVRGMS